MADGPVLLVGLDQRLGIGALEQPGHAETAEAAVHETVGAILAEAQADVDRFTRAYHKGVISFGERLVTLTIAKGAVDVWLNSRFEGGRHARRVDQITQLEADF